MRMAPFLFLLLPAVTLADGGPRSDAPADPGPTGFSCTPETLLSGAECVFESAAEAAADRGAQALENRRLAQQIAEAACVASARVRGEVDPDAALLALCKEEVGPVAAGCAVEGRRPLLDAHGRFAPEARACYLALAEVLQRTRLMASVSAGCCRCLAKAGDRPPAAQCLRALVSAKPRLPPRALEACPAACSAFDSPSATTSPDRSPATP